MSNQILPSQDDVSTASLAKTEAEHRAKFVRGMGGSLVGYCDGYADGFEQAVLWMLGRLPDPLSTEYRPGSGMKQIQESYKYRRKERARILKWFAKLSAAHTTPTTPTAPK